MKTTFELLDAAVKSINPDTANAEVVNSLDFYLNMDIPQFVKDSIQVKIKDIHESYSKQIGRLETQFLTENQFQFMEGIQNGC